MTATTKRTTRKAPRPRQRHPLQLQLVAALELVNRLSERIAEDLQRCNDHDGVELRTDAVAIAWNARAGRDMVRCNMTCPGASGELVTLMEQALDSAPDADVLASNWLANSFERYRTTGV